jgi:hypothetical protein
MQRFGRYLLAALLALPLTACSGGDEPLVLPDEATAAAAYGDEVEAEISGNLLRLTVPMPAGFERGGSLWEKSGPYFYLFTTATRDLFLNYPDLAAVEVSTTGPDGEEIARARLLRSALNEITWTRAIAYASQAQTEGTESPRYVDRLVRYGEEVVAEHE